MVSHKSYLTFKCPALPTDTRGCVCVCVVCERWKYAYGEAGHPGFKIPGKADLVFEIEVLGIKN